MRNFRSRIINLRKILEQEKQETFLNDKERLLVICDQLKTYLEAVSPEFIYKTLPLHYSDYLDEFMLTMIDGVNWSGHYKRKNLF